MPVGLRRFSLSILRFGDVLVVDTGWSFWCRTCLLDWGDLGGLLEHGDRNSGAVRGCFSSPWVDILHTYHEESGGDEDGQKEKKSLI